MRVRIVDAICMLLASATLALATAAAGPVDIPGVVVSPPNQSAAAAEVIALERQIGEAIVRGDAAFFDSVTSDDFVMVHGDGWTRGGKPALVDDKASFMKRVASKSYAAHDYD